MSDQRMFLVKLKFLITVKRKDCPDDPEFDTLRAADVAKNMRDNPPGNSEVLELDVIDMGAN